MEKADGKKTLDGMVPSVSAFKQLGEMSYEELMALPKGILRVCQETSPYDDRTRFNAYLSLCDDMLEIRFRLDRASYFVIQKLRQVDPGKKEFRVSFHYRVCKCQGRRKEDGSTFTYYYIEGFACAKQKKVRLQQFLKGSALDLIETIGLDGIVDRGLVDRDSVVGDGDYFDE